ncbi:MAG: hypothetical protein A2X08_07600 [Bacteroidetes bacterium GWA2_32_17]|nr:MAG: hypothetical protein A2X08_07600 [Bacteroidetes bacterium GWA2_32_17]
MSHFFLITYQLFKKHKLFFLFFLILITVSAVSFVYNIKIEEDINKAIPGKETKDKINIAFQNTGIADKLIINISLSDSTSEPLPDSLIVYAEDLANELKSKQFSAYLKNIFYKINDSLFTSIINVFYENYPLFLSQSDLLKLDSIISYNNIQNTINKDYESLISPASFAFKENITRDPLGIAAIALKKLKNIAINDNYDTYNGFIFSKNRKNLLMFANTVNASNKTSKNIKMSDLLEQIISKINIKHKNLIKTETFGSSLIAVANAKTLKNDIILTLSIATVLLILIISFSVKDKRVFFIIFIPTILAGGIALSALACLTSAISVITLSMAPIILAITVDYSLHIISHQKHKKDIVATIKDVAFPIMVCGIATAFEFISLFFVSSKVLQELGIFASISVFVSAVLTLIILPQFIDKKDISHNSEMNLLENMLDKITRFEFDRYKPIIISFSILTIVFAYYAFKVEFEGDMLKMNYMSDELKSAENSLKKINDFTENTAYVVSYGKNIEEALKNNEKVNVKFDELKSQKQITNYTAVSEILMSDLTQIERAKAWKNYWTSAKKDSLKANVKKVAVEVGFNENAFNEFLSSLDKEYNPLSKASFTLLKENLFKENFNEKDNIVNIVNILKTDKKYRSELKTQFSEFSNSTLIDRQSILMKYVEYLNKDFNFIANISLLLVLIILILAFGRIEIGFITFFPIFISWVWTLGIMGLFGIKFNIFNIIISSFITGMGVDYSTYIMQGLIQGYSTSNKTLISFKSNILVSAMITISGTGVLIFAKHPALNSIALISIIGLLSVVLISYTFEPLLFKLLVSKNGKNRVVPVTLSNLLLTIAAFTIFVTGSIFLNLCLLLAILLPVKLKLKKLFVHYCMMYSCRGLVYLLFPITKKRINVSSENFKKPSIIISNHQSHIDLVILLSLNPKMVVLTTNWVWESPFYGFVIRFIDFYNVNDGNESIINNLKPKIDEGYSVLVFPEGSRSKDQNVTRFHKGAFYLAKQLNLDIVPIIIHGAGDCMRKGENYVRSGKITLKVFARINAPHVDFGNDYHELTKSLQTFYRSNYKSLKKEIETVDYYADTLIKNHVFKGPILEWYCRIKIKLEDNYRYFNEIISPKADIMDIGCGYGFMSYMLGFLSDERKIFGVDYDADKIEIAQNCISKNENVKFEYADATQFPFVNKDVFILSDILHYISEEQQEQLISNCIKHLNNNGLIIIRDANKNLKARHWGTRYTEFFSTKTGFNKLEGNKLHFTNVDTFINIANKFNLKYEVIDNTKLTSNILFIIRK